jgi:hypothetical protein
MKKIWTKFKFVTIIRDSKIKNNTDGCDIFMSYDDMRFHSSEPTRKILNFFPKKIIKVFQLLVIKNQGLAPDPTNSANSWIRFHNPDRQHC